MKTKNPRTEIPAAYSYLRSRESPHPSSRFQASHRVAKTHKKARPNSYESRSFLNKSSLDMAEQDTRASTKYSTRKSFESDGCSNSAACERSQLGDLRDSKLMMRSFDIEAPLPPPQKERTHGNGKQTVIEKAKYGPLIKSTSKSLKWTPLKQAEDAQMLIENPYFEIDEISKMQ